MSLIKESLLRPDAEIKPSLARVEAVTQDQIPISGQCKLLLYKKD